MKGLKSSRMNLWPCAIEFVYSFRIKNNATMSELFIFFVFFTHPRDFYDFHQPHRARRLKASLMHGLRDSVPVCKPNGCYYVTQKFRATFHSYPSDARRSRCVDVNNLYCIYLFKLYDKSIIILLTNNLTNI